MSPNLIALLAFILLVVIPMYFLNNFLVRKIEPRKSFGRFLLYMASGLAIAFVYTFIFVWLLLKFVYVQHQ